MFCELIGLGFVGNRVLKVGCVNGMGSAIRYLMYGRHTFIENEGRYFFI